MEIKDKGVFKLVSASQLEYETSVGWRLVAVLDSDVLVPAYDTETGAVGTSYQTTSSTRHHVNRVQNFLLVLEEESRLAVMNDVVTRLQSEQDACVKARVELQGQLTNVTHECETYKGRVAALVEDLGGALAEASRAKQALDQYKIDVADMVKHANDIVADGASRKKTAYERVVDGGFDDGDECVSEAPTLAKFGG